jgi:hypothetical protein
MKPLTLFEMWYGRDEPPPEVIELKAGQLHAEFQEGDLRYIRYADQELIRRIYVGIRDVNWNTIPAEITNLAIDSADDRFQIHFDALHHDGPLTFRWHASIVGKPEGIIEYALDGVAESDFRYCRIGFCVLHPVEGIAGSPYRALTLDGTVSGVLSELIEPQRIENGLEIEMFPSFTSLTVDMPSGISITTAFEGDLFEMEDQRNWTDGSFKTYCTPISLGYPHNAAAGQAFHQKVTVKAALPKDTKRAKQYEDQQTIGLFLGDTTDLPLPRIGFGMASHGQEMGERETELLSRLRPDHLTAELHFQDASWLADLERAIATAKQIGAALELAVFLADDSEGALQTLKSRICGVRVARVIVFHETEAAVGTTSPRWMQLVREHLSDVLPGTQFLGGTNGNFAELNRQPPEITVMDGVSYTINPQVHAWDERSLVEAIEGQRDTVVTARSYCDGLSICVSPITLKPPFNQAASEEEAPQDPNELPAAVDQRQISLFAAAWTVGSIGSLALAGPHAITYYQTTGWRGLMETAEGSLLPLKFRSFPGMIYPVYWVFAFLADAKGATVLRLNSARPLLVAGLAFRKNRRLGLLVANLQPRTQAVCLGPLPDGKASLRRLNQDSMAIATSDPDAFLALAGPLDIYEGEAVHVLEPYETAFLEILLS